MSDHATHTALPSSLSAGAPDWARDMYAGLSCQLAETRAELAGMADEVETLRRLLAPRLVSRREAARIAGCSSRTIQRYEDRGHIARAPTKGGGAFYAYADVVKLKRMMK